MANEEIIKQYAAPRNYVGLEQMLDLARTDEREKIKNQMLDGVMTDSEFEEYTGSKRDQPQGVDCWVSWDNHHACGDVTASFKEPKANRNSDGSTYYNNYGAMSFDISQHAAKFLNIEPGQCKKFRIVEVE